MVELSSLKKEVITRKGAETNCKMQNLSQNELNQITTMYDQLRDLELEQITKMRRIKNYETMLKEELIISPLKSKP